MPLPKWEYIVADASASLNFSTEGTLTNLIFVTGSCHLDRASNDEFSVECLF